MSFILDALMLGGPIIAGGIQAGQQAGQLNDACSDLEDATNKYNATKDEWGNLVSDIELNFQKMLSRDADFATQLNNEYQLYSEKLTAYKNVFKQQQWEKDILFAIFIFCIIITLLFKYFKVFPTLWAYISGK